MKNKIALSIFLILGIFSFAEEEGKWKGAYNGENSYYFGENTWVDGSNTYSIGNNNYIYGNNNQVHGYKNKVGGENSRIDNNLVFGNNNEIYPDPINKATREYKVFLAVELPSGQNVGGVRSIREGEKVKFNGSVDGAKLVWWNNDIEKPIRNNSIIFGRFIENDKTETKQEELYSKLSLLISFTEEIVKGSKKFLKSSDEEKEEILENVEEVVKRASNNHGKSESAMRKSINECEDILKIFTEGEPKQNDTPDVNITENKSKPDFIGNIIKGNNNLVIGQGNAVFGANVHLGEKNKSSVNNNIILGSNITNTDVNNAIVFGNESKPIEGAVSIGNDTTTRQIKYVKAGVEDTDAVNVSQLKDYLKVDDKNKFLKSEDVDIKGDTYIKVTPDENKHNYYALTFNKDKLGENLDISKNSAITNINTKLDEKANLDATNVKGDSLTKWQNVLGTGTIDNNNTGLVTGGVVKTYVDSKIENSTNTINTTLDTKLNKEDLDVTGDGKYIDVTNEDTTKKKYKVAFKESALKQLVNDTDITDNTYLKAKLDDKADKNASNLTETDVTKWQEKLGNGSVTKGDTKLVKGGTVFTYVDNIANTIKQELSTKATGDLTKKLDVDAKNISTDGVTTLTTKLGTGEIKDNNNNLVTGGTVKKYITDEINTISNTVSGKLSSSDVDVTGDEYITVNKDVQKPNHYSLVFDKDKLATDLDLSKNTKLTEQFNKYALLDGSNLTSDEFNLNVWQAKLGNGEVKEGNTGLVKGGDIFTYVNNIKQELNNQATQDLSNKLDKDGSNLDKPTLDKLTNKLSEGSNLTTPTNRLVTDSKVSEALKGKLDIDANNLTKDGVNNLTNKLGTGTVTENNTNLVTGGKVYSELNKVKDELNKSISTNTQNITDLNNKYTTLNNQVTTNTGDISELKTTVNDLKSTKQDISNINNKLGNIDKSITTINNKLDDKLNKDDLSIKGDNYIKVENTNFNYKLSLNKDTLANDLDLTNNTSINNMFTTKLGDINTNIGNLKTKVENNTNSINSLKTTVNDNTNKITNLTTKVETNTNDINILKQDITKKLNVDADNLTTKGETNLIDKLSKGSDISKPNNKLVTDTQVNNYLSRYNDALGVVDKKSTVALEKSELALGGVANAVAMANLVQVNSYSRHRHNLSAAYGYYGGSHALAVGFSGTNEERNFVYKLSGSVNNKGNLAFGIGAGVMMGSVNDKDKRIEELTNEVKELRKENMEIKTLLRKIIKK